MKIESHLQNLKESLEIIGECINKGLLERQRTIGFHTSAAAVDLLEMLLHKTNLIDPGFVVKHEWFKSKNKKEIISLMFKIEEKRNTLCYGKPQKIELLQDVINNFNKLKKKFHEVGLNE